MAHQQALRCSPPHQVDGANWPPITTTPKACTSPTLRSHLSYLGQQKGEGSRSQRCAPSLQRNPRRVKRRSTANVRPTAPYPCAHHLWLPDCLPLREGWEKERHLLDCKVRSLTSGVKAPRPRAERAASRKTYSVLGFRPSTVKKVVGSKFFGT